MAGLNDAIAWRRGAHERVCDRHEAWAHGTVVWATEFPTFYDFNTLRLEGPDPGIDARELVAEADRLQSGLEHRKVEVDDVAAGERLRPGMEALGWRTTRVLWMVHDGPPPEPPAGLAVEEAERVEIRHLQLEWREHRTVEQVLEFLPVSDRVAEREGQRTAIVRGAAGPAIAFTTYTARPEGGEVMLVYVTETERGRGLGHGLTAWTTARVFAAGAPRVWITADDEYHAKDIYAGLGFRPVWVSHEFLREPAPAR